MKALVSAFALLAAVAGADMATAQTTPAAEVGCTGDVPLAATAERITYKSRGRDIEALLFRPTGEANGAGLLLLHGSEGLYEEFPQYEQQVNQLASRGYTVLVPNYYGASRQDPRTNPLVFDRWREAIGKGLDHLAGMRGISADKIGLWGFSLGGRLAMKDVLEGNDAKALVVVSTGGPLDRGETQTPILLLAGDHDPDQPVEVMRDWQRTLAERHVTADLQTFSANTPDFTNAAWCDAFDKSRVFFDQKLLGAAG